MTVYAASEPSKRYSHAWVTIERVTLTNGLTNANVFSSPLASPLKVDLADLHTQQGPAYLFLGNKEFSAGLFTKAQVRVGNSVSVETKAGEKRILHFLSGGQESVMWTLDLDKTKPIVPGTNLVLDFEPDRWSEKPDGTLKAAKDTFLVVGDGGGMMDPDRHLSQTLKGTVQDLTGAGDSKDFTLLMDSGSLEVRARTTKPVPFLSEGAQVEVKGTYDPAASIFNADDVSSGTGLAINRFQPPLRKPARARHAR
jgi:hypothetical protein